jgi:CheY-like chemotaxis protein
MAIRTIIVDDDRIFRFLISKILDSLNLEIELSFFENGEEFVEFMNTQANFDFCDIFLLDINMPIRNGWQVLNWVMESSFSTASFPKTYIVSSSIDPMDLKRATEHHLIKDYLIKPLISGQLNEVFSQFSSAN